MKNFRNGPKNPDLSICMLQLNNMVIQEKCTDKSVNK